MRTNTLHMDAYIVNPGLLNNQPKISLGDYVESNGLLVLIAFAIIMLISGSYLFKRSLEK